MSLHSIESYDFAMWAIEMADFEEVSLLQALMHYRSLVEESEAT